MEPSNVFQSRTLDATEKGSLLRARTRSRRMSNPAVPCTLLLMTYFIQRTSSAGSEGVNGALPQPRPPISTGSNRRREQAGNVNTWEDHGSGEHASISSSSPSSPSPPSSSSMCNPGDVLKTLSRQPNSAKSTASGSTGDTGRNIEYGNLPGAAERRGLEARGRLAPFSSSSSFKSKSTPGRFTFASSGGNSITHNSQYRNIVAARHMSSSAAERSADEARSILFERRAGGGGVSGNKENQEPEYNQQQSGQDRGEAFADDARFDDRGIGEGLSNDIPRMPRSTLEEQVYHDQHMYRPSTQFPVQVPGTQTQTSSLFRRTGGGGVCFVFFILVWRSLSNYEYVEQMSGVMRRIMYVPAIGLFLGNMVCMCLSLVSSAAARHKGRMKTMLTIDAIAEGVLLSYNVLRLLGSGSGEDFMSSFLANAWFLSVCFTLTKARWVADGAW